MYHTDCWFDIEFVSFCILLRDSTGRTGHTNPCTGRCNADAERRKRPDVPRMRQNNPAISTLLTWQACSCGSAENRWAESGTCELNKILIKALGGLLLTKLLYTIQEQWIEWTNIESATWLTRFDPSSIAHLNLLLEKQYNLTNQSRKKISLNLFLYGLAILSVLHGAQSRQTRHSNRPKMKMTSA